MLSLERQSETRSLCEEMTHPVALFEQLIFVIRVASDMKASRQEDTNGLTAAAASLPLHPGATLMMQEWTGGQ